ncbi:MAG: type II secretion system minor pseudopilin GspK [Gammaproteobacteria bacterium]
MATIVRQRGVAIITALLIVAIAATVSVTMSTRLQLDVRRTGNMIAGEQAYLYALAAESWSQRILKNDRQKNEIDHLGENWAMDVPPIPVEGGYIRGRLTDLQSCLNLNALLEDAPDKPVARPRLERLMTNLGLDNALVQAIIDWLDNDLQTTIPDGAEDVYYMNLERPYRTANRPILSISEMRLIRGFDDPRIYETLLPHVCAFGITAPININTASAEVLRSLADGISPSDVNDIVKQRTEEAFNTIQEFTSFNELGKIITSTENLSVDTEYFMLTVESTIGQVRIMTYSIIHRSSDGATRVIARSQGAY